MRQPESSKLAIHLRVLRSLVKREVITRFARTSGGYFWAIVEPVAVISLLAAVFSLLVRTPPLGDSFILFFATGWLAFSFYRGVSDFGSASIGSNKALLNFPSVSPYDTVIARVYLEAVTLALSAIITFALIFVFLDIAPSMRFGYIFAGAGLAVAFGLGVALANAVLFIYYPSYQRIFAILNRPLFIISGVLFIPEALPAGAREWVLWNPLTHIISLFRKGFYPEYDAPYVDLVYVGAVTLLVLTIGLNLIHRNRYAISEK